MAAFRARLTESARAFGDVFGNPNLRRIQLALLGSNLGAWAYIVAIAVYAYDQGGARAVGPVGASLLLAAFGAYETVFWLLATVVFLAGIAVLFTRETTTG